MLNRMRAVFKNGVGKNGERRGNRKHQARMHERGLNKDVSVVVWGEFGRTPTINKDAGRDHWPRVSCALLAGGGMRHGQVIGATDRLGGEATERPVMFGEVFATLYQRLGIDVAKTTVEDLSGRPQYL